MNYIFPQKSLQLFADSGALSQPSSGHSKEGKSAPTSLGHGGSHCQVLPGDPALGSLAPMTTAQINPQEGGDAPTSTKVHTGRYLPSFPRNEFSVFFLALNTWPPPWGLSTLMVPQTLSSILTTADLRAQSSAKLT